MSFYLSKRPEGAPVVPQNGGFPDGTTTGYPPGTVFTINDNVLFRSTADGQVIQNVHLTNSEMIVTHNNVTVRNCWFDSASGNNALRVFDDGTGKGNNVTIQDCTFFGHNNCPNGIALGAAIGATVLRCDISGCENGINVGTASTLLQDCYVHDLQSTGTPHYDCIEVNAGMDNFVMRHCTLINLQDDTACFQLNNAFGSSITNSQLVENCKLIDGGSATIYSDGQFNAQPLHNVTIKDCIIRAAHGFGLYTIVRNTINWQWLNNKTEAGVIIPDPVDPA